MKLKAAVARQYDNVVVQSRLRGKTSACQFTLHGNVVRSNEWLYLGQSLSLAIKDVYILRFWETRLCVRARARVCFVFTERCGSVFFIFRGAFRPYLILK